MKAILFGSLLLVSFNTHAAALMGFADSTMVMGEANEYSQEIMVNYSPKVGHAVGVELMRMSGIGEKPTNITALNYTGLIKRWNMPNGQANVWFMGGLGAATGAASGFAYTPSIQFDYETTRLYFLSKLRLVRAPDFNNDTVSLQAGFSFYETDFDETQPWLVVEAKKTRNFNPGTQITPALRLINKDYFLEFGITNPFDKQERTPRVNFMFIF